MVFKDTKLVAVHRISVDGPKAKSASSDPATKAAAYHIAACNAVANCQDAEATAAAAAGVSTTEPAPMQPQFPWSDLIAQRVSAFGATTANVNQKRMPFARQAARLTRKMAKKRGVEFVIVEASAGTPATCDSDATDAACCCPADAEKVAIEVPEIDSQEIAGEWLIPNDGILLVSFGPHTVADKDGKAVIRERLAIIVAEETTTPPATPAPARAAAAMASPSDSPSPALSTYYGRAFIAPAPAAAPMPEAAATSIPTPMPVPAAPIPPMPPVPSRSIPQGIHADGKAAELPPLPADEADDDDDDDSAEARPSPQTRKPRPADQEPAVKSEAKPRPAGDTAARRRSSPSRTSRGFPPCSGRRPGSGSSSCCRSSRSA